MSFVVPGLTHCEEHMNPIGLGYVCEECEEKRKLKYIDADKMFEELEYKIVENNDDIIKYENVENEDLNIVFNKEYKVIYGCPTYDYFCDMPILKAINKKVEELRLGGIVWMI